MAAQLTVRALVRLPRPTGNQSEEGGGAEVADQRPDDGLPHYHVDHGHDGNTHNAAIACRAGDTPPCLSGGNSTIPRRPGAVDLGGRHVDIVHAEARTSDSPAAQRPCP
jgi:hypothetical protein